MKKPIILAIDDEPAVLSAVERDLRRNYGKDYRVMRADSGATALETLAKLKQRNDPVALFLTDQRMPRMSGVEFLEEARQIYPEARRVLLTAYADTEAAIRAINEVKVHYYLMKPWDPPDERLYPVLDDLLDDWLASFRPPFEGIRVIGHRWSLQSYQVKDFLARNLVPYQWLDIETDQEACRLLDSAKLDTSTVPVVFLTDGSYLVQPSNLQVAEKVGLKLRAQMPLYDLIVIGGGPAGLGAAVYGASEGLRTLIIEREAPGGQAGMSSRIENYLGFPGGLSGSELARRARDQARKFGAEILTPQEVSNVRVQDTYKVVTLADGTALNGRALLIATGVAYRTLDVPGMDALTGAGVFYGAAVTEAMACSDQDVFVVGGGNSAGQAAMYLSKFARSVTILVRGESLSATMSDYLIDQLGATKNIQVQLRTTVTAVRGTSRLESISVKHVDTNAERELPAAAIFIFIGAVPRTEWLTSVVERDKAGFILTGADFVTEGRIPKGWSLERPPFWLESSVPGIFAAGDVRRNSVKRVAAAVGEGGMTITFVHRYLASV